MKNVPKTYKHIIKKQYQYTSTFFSSVYIKESIVLYISLSIHKLKMYYDIMKQNYM